MAKKPKKVKEVKKEEVKKEKQHTPQVSDGKLWKIVKLNQTEADDAYSGELCREVGIEYGKIYHSKAAAETDAKRLGVKFKVVERF